LFKLSFRKSESVKIDNEELIPNIYVREELVSTVNKKELKQALKNGEVPGCHIETKQNLQIK